MTSTCTADRHDTLAAYKHSRCRCPRARAANTTAMKAYRLRLLAGWTGHVDGTGTRRRLQALVANGWPLQILAAELRISRSAVSQLCNSRARTRVTTVARVRAAYDRLADSQGPSNSSKVRARRRGWLPPLWWDDDTIDDPTYIPSLVDAPRPRADVVDPVVVDRLVDGVDAGVRPTPQERYAAFVRLSAADVDRREIRARLRLPWSTFAEFRTRLDAAGISTTQRGEAA